MPATQHDEALIREAARRIAGGRSPAEVGAEMGPAATPGILALARYRAKLIPRAGRTPGGLPEPKPVVDPLPPPLRARANVVLSGETSFDREGMLVVPGFAAVWRALHPTGFRSDPDSWSNRVPPKTHRSLVEPRIVWHAPAGLTGHEWGFYLLPAGFEVDEQNPDPLFARYVGPKCWMAVEALLSEAATTEVVS